MGDNAAFRDGFRALADTVRRIPEAMGTRSTTVTIRVRVYSGPINATGTTLTSTTDIVLDPRPKVRQATVGHNGYFGGGWATLAGALAGERVYAIGPMTLNYSAGGYAASDLAPSETNKIRVSVLLAGDDFTAGGEEFGIVEVHADHPFRVELLVSRKHQGA